MIELQPDALIGRGLHRECYRHPTDPGRCVKIVVAGNSDENRREAAYYARLAARGIDWDRLARFHGLATTDRGEGAVFDLVCDPDGSVSRPLDHYLACRDLSGRHAAELAAALQALRSWLLQHRVVTMTLKAKNILVQWRDGDCALVLVDNVGNTDFIPLTNYWGWLARRKIRRKWRRFIATLRRDYPGHPALEAVPED